MFPKGDAFYFDRIYGGFMNKKLTYLQIDKNNAEHFENAKSLWLPFICEVNEHDGITETEEEIIDDLRKRIDIQGNRSDMHFEIAFLEDKPIGIAMFAIDKGTVYGLLEAGYGTVMGFFIKPEHRRKGLGREFFYHIERILKKDGASKLYLTPDGVTGEPFWKAMGFTDSRKIDPDNKMPIYIKEEDLMLENELESLYDATPVNGKYDAGFVTMFYNNNIEPLHGTTITYEEWCYWLSKKDPDEAHFIIHKGAMPVAWLKLNGILDGETGWISMLAVDPPMQHKGAGKYAVEFSEQFFRSKGKNKVGIHTTNDNITAQNLYKKCGYEITEYGECTTGDGVKRMGYTFIKYIT